MGDSEQTDKHRQHKPPSNCLRLIQKLSGNYPRVYVCGRCTFATGCQLQFYQKRIKDKKRTEACHGFHAEGETMRTSKIMSSLLCFILVLGLAVPAFAANEPYEFRLGSKPLHNEEYFRDLLNNTNTKTQPNDPATISCLDSNAPGWGYYLRLKTDSYDVYTYSYWYTNANNLRHPTYVNLPYANYRDYHIEGRYDNDYSAPYYIYGKFNADYTNP